MEFDEDGRCTDVEAWRFMQKIEQERQYSVEKIVGVFRKDLDDHLEQRGQSPVEHTMEWSFSKADWYLLPSPVLVKISSYLSWRGIMGMQATCRQWRKAISQDVVSNDVVQLMLNHKRTVKERQKEMQKQKQRDERRARMRKVEESLLYVIIFGLPLLILCGLQLGIAIAGYAVFSNFGVSTIPPCFNEAQIYTMIYVLSSLFLFNFVLVLGFFCVALLGRNWMVKLGDVFALTNSVGVLNNATITGVSAFMVATVRNCLLNAALVDKGIVLIPVKRICISIFLQRGFFLLSV